MSHFADAKCCNTYIAPICVDCNTNTLWQTVGVRHGPVCVNNHGCGPWKLMYKSDGKTIGVKPGNGCIQYHGPQPWFCGVLKIWWKPLVTWKELYAYNTVVHSHGFEHGLILGSPLSKKTTKPWLWTTVLYAFITWLHTNGFTNVSFLLKTFGYIPGFVDKKYIHYHASHRWFHQCTEDSTKPWL